VGQQGGETYLLHDSASQQNYSSAHGIPLKLVCQPPHISLQPPPTWRSRRGMSRISWRIYLTPTWGGMLYIYCGRAPARNSHTIC